MDILFDSSKSPFILSLFVYGFVFLLEITINGNARIASGMFPSLYRDSKRLATKLKLVIKYVGGFFKSLSYIWICVSTYTFADKTFRGNSTTMLIYAIIIVLTLIVFVTDIFVDENRLIRIGFLSRVKPESIYYAKKVITFICVFILAVLAFLILPEAMYSIGY